MNKSTLLSIPESPRCSDEYPAPRGLGFQPCMIFSDSAEQIDRYLSSLFLQIGIPANRPGYRFLREAVHLVLEEPALQNMLMRGLYPRIAENFHTSVYCVEHSMRCAITAAWSRGRPELAEKLLGRGVMTAYDKPTNGEMIALVAENVRLLLMENHL